MSPVRPFLILLIGLILTPEPAYSQAPKGKKYALLVGVTEYRGATFPALAYTENDIDGLAAILRDKNAAFDQIRVLSSSRGKKSADDAPTAGNLTAALAHLLADKGKDDIVLLALAGHGAQIEVRDPDGEGKSKTYSYFCPADADLTGISYSTGHSKTLLNLADTLELLGKCGAGTKLVLLDACRNDVEAKSAARNIDPGEMKLPRGVAALFSCGPGERAWETSKLGKGHGVFFYHVLEGLRDKAKNDKGEVTWPRLAEYVQGEVSRDVPKLIGGGAKQSPNSLANLVGPPPVLARGLKVTPKAETKSVVKTVSTPTDPAPLFAKALAHAEGKGERYDPAEAARLFRQAADSGHDLARAALAYALARGVGVGRDEAEAQQQARRCFTGVRSLAEKDGDAMALFGRLHAAGLGTAKNDAAALEWYKKGAEKGSSLAMLELGVALSLGRGTQVKEREAFGWLSRAAGKGNADALFLVGKYHAEGNAQLGLKKNAQVALTSLKKAAANGHNEARELVKKIEK